MVSVLPYIRATAMSFPTKTIRTRKAQAATVKAARKILFFMLEPENMDQTRDFKFIESYRIIPFLKARKKSGTITGEGTEGK
jgi:hypothetical protein